MRPDSSGKELKDTVPTGWLDGSKRLDESLEGHRWQKKRAFGLASGAFLTFAGAEFMVVFYMYRTSLKDRSTS